MADETLPANELGITGSAPLYVRPEPLNPEQHGNLGVDMRQRPYGFAAKQHFIPLLAGEFTQASTSFPIIFAGEDRVPLAVMGLAEGENLFFHEDGDAMPFTYVPAYVRRYPFTVASDELAQQMIVCIDRESPLVTETGEARFFEGKELTEYGKASVAFCENYERERIITMGFIDKLKELDVFEPRDVTHTPRNADGSAGEPQVLASFFSISEDKLQALSPEKYAELRPAMGAVYAQLISQTHWERLIQMALTRQAEQIAAAGQKPN